MGNLHILKTGVIHQNQAGLLFSQSFQPLRFIAEAGSGHADKSQQPDQYPPEDSGLSGFFVLWAGQRHDFVKVHLFYGGLHGARILSQQITMIQIHYTGL